MKVLDLFCGLGGWSKGFHAEGYECIGVDIVDVGYPYKIIIKDLSKIDDEFIEQLKKENFDIIVSSPPCRDVTAFARCYGKRWKNPPNPENFVKLFNSAMKIIEALKPKYWLIENVKGSEQYIDIKPKFIGNFQRGKKHCLWGWFPDFIFTPKDKILTYRDGSFPEPIKEHHNKLQSWLNAEIPFEVSNSLARTISNVEDNLIFVDDNYCKLWGY
jgi:hypothetical protein